jgi:pimeloyl-ACP methyl ester carboxylesterase
MLGRLDTWRFALAAVVTAAALIIGAARAQELTLEPRPGVTLALRIAAPDRPRAAVLLFEGGSGKLNASGRGFLVANHEAFAERGLFAALLDAPSDQTGWRGGMHPRFRLSAEHATDIDAALAALRARSGLPVWLVGISLGTRSAASYASRRPDALAGLVLLSSSTRPKGGKPVTQMGLGKLRVPVLAVAHRDDGCPGTPPAGAQAIVDAATASPNAKALIVTGGREEGRNPCVPRSHHTYNGIEDEVVDAIAAFIKDNS